MGGGAIDNFSYEYNFVVLFFVLFYSHFVGGFRFVNNSNFQFSFQNVHHNMRTCD